MENQILVSQKKIESQIFLIRDQKVLLGPHIAELYGVEPRALNQAVKRNSDRFPPDFMFQLTEIEADLLVSQFVIPHKKYFGGSLPYAFTEESVAMLASVLRSPQAVQVNIAIMRAFVKLREILGAHREFAYKLEQLETKMEKHDAEIHAIFDAIRRLMTPPEPPVKKRIGFGVEEPKASFRSKRKNSRE